MRKTCPSLVALLVVACCALLAPAQIQNEPATSGDRPEFQPLFNGRDLADWRHTGVRYAPSSYAFEPLTQMRNPGGTNEKVAMRRYFSEYPRSVVKSRRFGYAVPDVAPESLVSCKFIDVNKANFVLSAWELDSSASAEALERNLAGIARREGGAAKQRLWRRGNWVFELLAEREISDKSFVFFEKHVDQFLAAHPERPSRSR